MLTLRLRRPRRSPSSERTYNRKATQLRKPSANDVSWLEPYPDALLPATSSPEETLRLPESARLAFVRAMQVLPPRQRAALILHDVLDFGVSDVAAMLETTVPAIKSVLQRARAALERAPIDRDDETRAAAHECIEARKAKTVARVVRAWETGDFAELVSMLTEDAVLTMPPWIYWLAGRDAVSSLCSREARSQVHAGCCARRPTRSRERIATRARAPGPGRRGPPRESASHRLCASAPWADGRSRRTCP